MAKLKNEKIKHTIVPAPRKFSASCGMSIMYNIADEERIKEIVLLYKIEIKGYFID